jgi:hypothetical protein
MQGYHQSTVRYLGLCKEEYLEILEIKLDKTMPIELESVILKI